MTKALISVSGADTTGIIARIATKLYEMNINILDIDQSISQGYFHMMMIVDANAADCEYSALITGLDEIGSNLGVQIKMQHEDIFNIMHRI